MLNYPKISAAEADKALNDKKFEVLEEGCYRFTVKKVDNKCSKTGNMYLSYQHSVMFNGKKYTIFDKLILTEGWAWKIRHFCESVNRISEYDNDTFDGGNANDTGIFIIKVKGYGDEKQNEVVDYLTEAKAKEKGHIIKNDGEKVELNTAKNDEFQDDNIPF